MKKERIVWDPRNFGVLLYVEKKKGHQTRYKPCNIFEWFINNLFLLIYSKGVLSCQRRLDKTYLPI